MVDEEDYENPLASLQDQRWPEDVGERGMWDGGSIADEKHFHETLTRLGIDGLIYEEGSNM